MAESHNQGHGSEAKETTGCGLFDFLGKKEGKTENDVVMTDYELEKKEEVDKHTLEEVLHRTHSLSSSSSEEEVEEGGEWKKKKKKGVKEMIKEKVSGEKEENGGKEPVTVINPAEKCHETGCCEATHGDEKKGFLEKIKEKLPGQHKKTEDGIQTAQPEYAAEGNSPGGETKEKKGILEKIKDKLPGAHKNDNNEVKHTDH